MKAKGLKLLIGAKEQKGFVESVSVMRSEVKIKRADEEGEGFRRVLVTMPFEELRRRMNGKELTVAAFGDGIATLYIAMIMMGFKIKKYYSVESDPTSRRIADANVGKVMDRSLGNDVMDIRTGQLTEMDAVDLLFMTPSCNDWSNLQDWPPGI